MAGLASPWVKHLQDKDSRDKFEQTVRNSTVALSRLYDLLEESEKYILDTETNLNDFESPAWEYKQAFRNGKKSQIKELKQLLAFLKE